MLQKDKIELIRLLNEFKRLLPPVEERKFLTNHYAKLEKQIDAAVSQLKDEDYQYVKGINAKLLELQLKGKITPDEYIDHIRIDFE